LSARAGGAGWSDYVAIARPGHWIKHIFLLPGLVAALVLVPGIAYPELPRRLILGFLSACLVASANYVINEWLDQDFDRHHPLKNRRPAVLGKLSKHGVYAEYVLLAATGMFTAYLVNLLFVIASVAFLVSGLIYNVRPLRTKDRVYVDVLSEAVNNPIRLLLGWAIASGTSVPPLSLVGAFWTGGAFLMAAKRLAEYRFIAQSQGRDAPGRYRRSLRAYSIESLTI
jgi:4-hydroxybenzoate polyprenyltransferase